MKINKKKKGKVMDIIWNNRVEDLYDDVYAEMAAESSYEGEDIDESEAWERAGELIELYFEDEMTNLDIDKKNEIFLVGTLNRWDGAHSAYRSLNTNNIGLAMQEAISAFGGDNTFEIGVEDGKMLIRQWGHDNPVSPSEFEFRMVKGFRSLDDMIYESDDDSTKFLISHSEPLAKDVAGVYGWE